MKENNKIQPLNSTLPEFFLDDVERRLETDPLTLGGLVDLVNAEDVIQEASCSPFRTCTCDGFEGMCQGLTTCGDYNPFAG